MKFKERIYQQFHAALKDKVDSIKRSLVELKETGANETKSTAGDKHETALAMLQIEQENKRKQLKDAEELLLQFQKINPDIQSGPVMKGSLVKTSRGLFLVSAAAGKIELDGMTIIAVSALSPLGNKLMGLCAGASIEVNGIGYDIENIE